jgi:hypothetical protein
MMRRFLTTALALPLAVAGTLTVGAAQAQEIPSFTEQAVISCLSGATVSGLTSGLILMPLVNSGVATSIAVSAVAASATVGCGAGVAYIAAYAGYSWAWHGMSDKTTPQPTPAMPATTVKGLIHAAW